MSIISHSFNVNEISIRGKATPKPVYNELDSFGVLLGLPRLHKERNPSYKQRLLDVFTRRASSSYVGLLNGITRELGLKFFNPVRITRTGFEPNNNNAAIEFIENKVIVYSDYANKTIELELNRSRLGEQAYWLKDFVELLNDDSQYFQAELTSTEFEFTRTDTIVNQGSAKLVTSLPLRQSQIQILGFRNIEEKSVVFTDSNTFGKEVANESSIIRPGDFFINYTDGYIKSFSTPREGARIRFYYHLQEFEPLASPVIIKNLQEKRFKEEMFIEVLAQDGQLDYGVPSELGSSIINELMSVFPMYWGA